jgi:hypothetical protein
LSHQKVSTLPACHAKGLPGHWVGNDVRKAFRALILAWTLEHKITSIRPGGLPSLPKGFRTDSLSLFLQNVPFYEETQKAAKLRAHFI